MTMYVRHTPHARCPGCNGKRDTRLVPRAAGESPELRHWVCDHCKIGWYILKGAPAKGWGFANRDTAMKAYVPPVKGG